MRQVITTLAEIGLAIAFLVHFILISIYGSVLIQEPRYVILVAETLGMLILIALGISNLIALARKEVSSDKTEDNKATNHP